MPMTSPAVSGKASCNWLRGPCYGDDREHDPSELEPSIGAPETTNYRQTESQEFTWSLPSARGGLDDREYDPGESGIGDGAECQKQLGEW